MIGLDGELAQELEIIAVIVKITIDRNRVLLNLFICLANDI